MQRECCNLANPTWMQVHHQGCKSAMRSPYCNGASHFRKRKQYNTPPSPHASNLLMSSHTTLHTPETSTLQHASAASSVDLPIVCTAKPTHSQQTPPSALHTACCTLAHGDHHATHAENTMVHANANTCANKLCRINPGGPRASNKPHDGNGNTANHISMLHA